MSERVISVLPDAVRPLLEGMHALARELGVQPYVTGGFVRDIFLSRKGVAAFFDVDFVLDADADRLAGAAAARFGGTKKSFPAFLTFKVEAPSQLPGVAEFDIATAREETYAHPGALPRVQPASMDRDLKRRDFSVNAMALPLAALVEESVEALPSLLLDPFHGYDDLMNGELRVLHDRSFIDDPTRLFRGCRYVVRIGGRFEPGTAQRAAEAIRGGALETISSFRIITELKKAICEPGPAEVFGAMSALGLLALLPHTTPGGKTEASLCRLASLLRGTPQNLRADALLRVLAATAPDREAFFRAASMSRTVSEAIRSDCAVIDAGGSPASEAGAVAARALGSVCP